MAHDVFISHSTNNRPVANAVCAALERDGIRCWIAPRDVMPGRPYSGEITRAIQQSRAFVLIFSEHSNNSEQVLREVQLAANSRLHIIQFRIDPVVPSDDLEYYLSGPHWLDAVTPPLESHIAQLQASVKALLALPEAEEKGKSDRREARPATRSEPVRESRPVRPEATTSPSPLAAQSSPNVWKWIALTAVALTVLGGAALFLVFGPARSKPAEAIAPSTSITPEPQTRSAVPPTVKAEPLPVAPSSIAAPPTNATKIVSEAEAERYAKAFYHEMERGDVSKAAAYLDETIDFYSFGPKDKAFVTEQMRQFVTALSLRSFTVGNVKVQDSPKSMTATLLFEVQYSARDVFGNSGTGRTRVEWDVAKRGDALKIVRSNWITYPDPSPAR